MLQLNCFFSYYILCLLHFPTYYFKRLATWGIPNNHASLVTLLSKQSLPPCNFCAMKSFDQPFHEENL